MCKNQIFSFEYTSLNHKFRELEKLDAKKVSQVRNTPFKLIKENKEVVDFFIRTTSITRQVPRFPLH